MTTNDSKIPGAFLCLYLCSPYIQMKLASSSSASIIYSSKFFKAELKLYCVGKHQHKNPCWKWFLSHLCGCSLLHRFIIYFVKVLVFDSISWIFVEFQTWCQTAEKVNDIRRCSSKSSLLINSYLKNKHLRFQSNSF